MSRRAAAEGFAAFALVFAGCGAIVSNAVDDGVLGAISAVTLAFTATRHFPLRDALVYVIAQLAGAVLAALVLLALPARAGRRSPRSRGASRFALTTW